MTREIRQAVEARKQVSMHDLQSVLDPADMEDVIWQRLDADILAKCHAEKLRRIRGMEHRAEVIALYGERYKLYKATTLAVPE